MPPGSSTPRRRGTLARTGFSALRSIKRGLCRRPMWIRVHQRSLRTGTAVKPNERELRELRILAVDDEEPNLRLLQRILERDGYTRVHVTTDPSKVPGLFVEIRPDLVLLDLHMPRMDGFELLDRLTPLTGDGGDVPFLVLTADATDETKRRALSVGARDFLTKPLDRIELLL